MIDHKFRINVLLEYSVASNIPGFKENQVVVLFKFRNSKGIPFKVIRFHSRLPYLGSLDTTAS
jgi:hypothetical protein